MRDPYEVLGIQRGATDDEIKKAYRAKCKRWHPDLNPNDPTAEEHFKEVQAAYDAITKGDTGPQMGGQPGGGYGYGQQGYYQGGYQQGYDQGYSQNGWQQGDFGFGFDPFGFGFGFGGYQQQSGASYSGSDSPEMQAARNFVANGRYAEARRVLDSMNSRSARWYYLSSLANQGLGNSIDALQDARRAVQLLLWRRLGLAVPDVTKKRRSIANAVLLRFLAFGQSRNSEAILHFDLNSRIPRFIFIAKQHPPVPIKLVSPLYRPCSVHEVLFKKQKSIFICGHFIEIFLFFLQFIWVLYVGFQLCIRQRIIVSRPYEHPEFLVLRLFFCLPHGNISSFPSVLFSSGYNLKGVG